jgi:NADPH:quinone reductase-like Zn-dependent oxidoreductase
MLVSTYGRSTQDIEGLSDVAILTSSKQVTGLLEGLLSERLAEAGAKSSIVQFEQARSIVDQRKPCIVLADLYESVLDNMDADTYQALQDIVANSQLVLWVTAGGVQPARNPHAGIVVGLGRVIRAENQGFRFVTLDLSGDLSTQTETELSAAATRIRDMAIHIITTQGSTAIENEYAEVDGLVNIARLVPAAKPTSFLSQISRTEEPKPLEFGSEPALKLDIKTQGMLGSLYFHPDATHEQELQPSEIEIEVRATGLNFRDVVVALGQMPMSFFGCECAGIVKSVGSGVTDFRPGDRVCAVTNGSFQTYYRADSSWFQLIPDNLSFEQAAAIPLAYCTAYYSLIDVARLAAKETILIHAAAGGVGQAAIVLAQMQGAEIYVTVGTPAKKQLVMERYGIPEDHVFSSRDLSFATALRRSTGGRGVDVVLNSLSGEALRESWRCVAPFGRFVEIGKRDIRSNGMLEMQQFAQNVSFTAVEYEGMLFHNKDLGGRIAADVIELARKGIATAAEPLTIYPYSQIEDALRLMQGGKHIGKVVLVPHVEDVVPVN